MTKLDRAKQIQAARISKNEQDKVRVVVNIFKNEV